jgi:hypothetical protein
MKTSFILYSRNDGYKETERFKIHMKSVLEVFDEVIYVDWNSEGQSFLYEILEDIPKVGKINSVKKLVSFSLRCNSRIATS